MKKLLIFLAVNTANITASEPKRVVVAEKKVTLREQSPLVKAGRECSTLHPLGIKTRTRIRPDTPNALDGAPKMEPKKEFHSRFAYYRERRMIAEDPYVPFRYSSRAKVTE